RFRTANGSPSINIVRFNDDGTLDSTFSTGLGVTHSKTIASVRALAIQADGKILVGGLFESFNGSTQNTLLRLNSNGTVDNSFALSGDVSNDPLNSFVEDIFIQADGRILVGGQL